MRFKSLILSCLAICLLSSPALAQQTIDFTITPQTSSSDPTAGFILYSPQDVEPAGVFQPFAQSYTIGATDAPNNTFATPQEAIDFYTSAVVASIMSGIDTAFPGAYEVGEMIYVDVNNHRANEEMVDAMELMETDVDALYAADLSFTSAGLLMQDRMTAEEGWTSTMSSDIAFLSSNKMATSDHTWANLSGKPSTFTPAAHSHAISDVTGLQTALDAKQAAFTACAHINDAATNAPTNLNVLTTLLGTLTGEVNETNTKQNDLATKFNTLLDCLEGKGILTP